MRQISSASLPERFIRVPKQSYIDFGDNFIFGELVYWRVGLSASWSVGEFDYHRVGLSASCPVTRVYALCTTITVVINIKKEPVHHLLYETVNSM